MNSQSFELYIGSNNDTHKLELQKIIDVTLKHYDGATIIGQGVTGIWKGGTERTAIVTVLSDQGTLLKYMEDLKTELKQDAIGYREVTPISFHE